MACYIGITKIEMSTAMTTDNQRYVNKAQVYLNQAWEELERQDLQQASEKGWGAASQMVKAVAVKRGLRHSRHKSLHQVARRLTEITNDPAYRRLFDVADVLHSNFYDGFLDAEDVEGRLRDVSVLLDKLRAWA